MDKEHRDPETVDLKAPRVAQYMETAWKEHQNTVYWVDIRLVQKKGLKFYQTRSNAITPSSFTIHSQPFVSRRLLKMETGEIMYEEVYESPRPPPKNSLRDNWMKELGSDVARQAESSQPNQTQIQLTEHGDLL